MTPSQSPVDIQAEHAPRCLPTGQMWLLRVLNVLSVIMFNKLTVVNELAQSQRNFGEVCTGF